MNNKETITSLFRKYNIIYWTEGKNVSVGYVNISCPFCPDGDPSNHCGTCIDSMIFHCWRCGKTGHFSFLLAVKAGISHQKVLELLDFGHVDFKRSVVSQIKERFQEEDESEETKELKEINLPEYFELVTPDLKCKLLDDYLERRRYNRDDAIKYGCGICRVGDMSCRMVIPVYFHGKLVAYQGADMTGRSETKYRADSVKSNVKRVLYDYDNLKDANWIVVTEGVFDKWRVSKNAVCSFSSTLTNDQKHLIIQKKPERLTFLYDSDAYWTALKQSKYFKAFVDRVDVVKLPPDKDPDDLEKEEILELIGA